MLLVPLKECPEAGSGSAEGCWRLEPADDVLENCYYWDKVLQLLDYPARNSIKNKGKKFLHSFAFFLFSSIPVGKIG